MNPVPGRKPGRPRKHGRITCRRCARPFHPRNPENVYCSRKCYHLDYWPRQTATPYSVYFRRLTASLTGETKP